MAENKSEGKSGFGVIRISTVVGIVFIILKLTGVIDWSWWAVTAPIWVVWGLVFGLVLVCVILAGGITAEEKLAHEIRKLAKEHRNER